MQKKYKIIGILFIFLAYSTFIYFKFPNFLEPALEFAAILIAILYPTLSDNPTQKPITNPLPHTKQIILKINKTIREVKNKNFNQALQLIQSARININTHTTNPHRNKKTSTRIFHLFKKIEISLLNPHNKIVKIKHEIQIDLFELKEIIELEEMGKDSQQLSWLTKTAIYTYIPLILSSILISLYFHAINKSYLNFGFITSIFLFVYFSITFFGLLFNQKWAKTCVKITFGFFMAIMLLLLTTFGGDGFLSY